MIHEARFLEALKRSGVSKVAVIDDAFNPPAVTEANAADVLDLLESPDHALLRAEVGLDQADIAQAIAAIPQQQYGDEALGSCVAILYGRFIDTLEGRFDPAEVFRAAKGPNLTNVLPILRLLRKADGVEVTWVGSREEDLDGVDPETHLIFVDYYLDDTLSASGDITSRQKASARGVALDRVRRIVDAQKDQAPAVILMSSRSVGAQAEKFRNDIGAGQSRVFASRFSFIEKTQVTETAGDAIDVAAEAADALLDIVQSYDFGRALHTALETWVQSAKAAVGDLHDDIAKLDLKDIAYLVRFRLAAEGQGLLSYLEWFFGECLLDKVGTHLDATTAAKPEIRAVDKAGVADVEGAFDGPTTKIADLYHRIRIEQPRGETPRTHRLGDLYKIGEGKGASLAAVMTPDCDLIPRGAKQLRRAPSALVITGKLKSFDAPDTSVSDFIIIDGKPYNVAWNKKDLKVFAFEALPDVGKKGDIEFLGALRPMYAQALQRDALNDLTRVGLSVAPALGVAASVRVIIKGADGKLKPLVVDMGKAATCYVIPPRGSDDASVVQFRRQFISQFLAAVGALTPQDVPASAAGNLGQLQRPDAYLKLVKLVQSGVGPEDVVNCGVVVTSKPTIKGFGDGAWCWLQVTMGEAAGGAQAAANAAAPADSHGAISG